MTGGSRPVDAVLYGDMNLLRCLAGQGLCTLILGSEGDELTFHSRYCHRRALIADPRCQPQQALADLVALGRTFPQPPALLFDNEPMLLLVSRHRDVLRQYYRFLLPDAGLVEDTADKVRFAQLARRLNLPVPRTLLSREVRSAQEAAERLSLPCVFKPVSHVAWYGAPVVRQLGGKPFKALPAHTPEEFGRLWQGMSQHAAEFVVQEYISGPDDCIYSFHAYLDRDLRPLGHYVGRKIRTYPKTAGGSTYLRLVRAPHLTRLGLEILTRMRHVGPVKLDFKRDPTRGGRFYLLEANSRFNLWSHLGAACGINLPQIACRDLYGGSAPPLAELPYRTDVRWLAFGNDLRAFLRDYRPEGDLNCRQWLTSLCAPKVYDVFCWNDPRPALVAVRRWAQLFLSTRLPRWRQRRQAGQATADPPALAAVWGSESDP